MLSICVSTRQTVVCVGFTYIYGKYNVDTLLIDTLVPINILRVLYKFSLLFYPKCLAI